MLHGLRKAVIELFGLLLRLLTARLALRLLLQLLVHFLDFGAQFVQLLRSWRIVGISGGLADGSRHGAGAALMASCVRFAFASSVCSFM